MDNEMLDLLRKIEGMQDTLFAVEMELRKFERTMNDTVKRILFLANIAVPCKDPK